MDIIENVELNNKKLNKYFKFILEDAIIERDNIDNNIKNSTIQNTKKIQKKISSNELKHIDKNIQIIEEVTNKIVYILNEIKPIKMKKKARKFKTMGRLILGELNETIKELNIKDQKIINKIYEYKTTYENFATNNNILNNNRTILKNVLKEYENNVNNNKNRSK